MSQEFWEIHPTDLAGLLQIRLNLADLPRAHLAKFGRSIYENQSQPVMAPPRLALASKQLVNRLLRHFMRTQRRSQLQNELCDRIVPRQSLAGFLDQTQQLAL